MELLFREFPYFQRNFFAKLLIFRNLFIFVPGVNFHIQITKGFIILDRRVRLTDHPIH